MAPHSSTLAWKIPWTEEPGRLQSMGSLGVGHNWATSLSLFTFMHWRRKWQPTPVFLPGESQGQGSLVSQSRTWLNRLSSSSSIVENLSLMASHSSTLAWKIPWTEEPGGLVVHGVARSRTWLSDFTFTFQFHALEKEMATHSSILAWRTPGMGEPSGLSSLGLHRVGHDWSDLAAAALLSILYIEVWFFWQTCHILQKSLNKLNPMKQSLWSQQGDISLLHSLSSPLLVRNSWGGRILFILWSFFPWEVHTCAGTYNLHADPGRVIGSLKSILRSPKSPRISSSVCLPWRGGKHIFFLKHSPCLSVQVLFVKLCMTLVTPWTVALQAPLSMGLPRQEY